MGQNEMWPSAVVGGLLLLLIGGVTIAAIVEYESVDDALRFWEALTGLAGVITGAFTTYFFTRGSVQQAQQAASQQTQAAAQAQTAAQQLVTQAQATAQQAQQMAETKDSLAEARHSALTRILGELDPQVAQQFLSNPDIKRAVSYTG